MPKQATDERWMRLALNLARRGLGNVWPNPAVGCVIVKNDIVVGRGWTQSGGRPHAETVALEGAGKNAEQATAYVTLEPCSHHGKTPPCSEALIKSGVKRVVCALEDPDNRVSGRGFEMLLNAGIEVTINVLNDEALQLNQGYILNRTLGRPLVTMKIATTLDGRIATRSGESRWITGQEARKRVHLLRSEHDAVLIGAGTARVDNPMLDVRGMGDLQNPIRIVLDGGLSVPLTSRLAQSAKDIPLWICHRSDLDVSRKEAWNDIGAELIEISHNDLGELDLAEVMQTLGNRGVTRVLCEAGARLSAAMVKAELVDRLVHFQSGKIIGHDGIPVIGPLNLDNLRDAPKFKMVSTQVCGPDSYSEFTSI